MILGLVQDIKILETKYEASFPIGHGYISNYNIREKDMTPFISSIKTHEISMFRFGMTSASSKGETLIFEAPLEGNRHSMDGGVLKKGIIQSPLFRKQIREQRGILPIDYFVLQNTSGKPYLVFRNDRKRPFALACIWDCLDLLTYGFAIITVPAMNKFLNIGIKRLPLILEEKDYKRWLKTDRMLTEVSEILSPYDELILNAFPISEKILNGTENTRELINPMGDLVFSEEKTSFSKIASRRDRMRH